MDGTTVLVAVIAAAPPTLAIIAGQWRNGHKTSRIEEKVDNAATLMSETNTKVDRIDHAVNNQPHNEPPLVEHVKDISLNVLDIKADVRVLSTRADEHGVRIGNLERKVG